MEKNKDSGLDVSVWVVGRGVEGNQKGRSKGKNKRLLQHKTRTSQTKKGEGRKAGVVLNPVIETGSKVFYPLT